MKLYKKVRLEVLVLGIFLMANNAFASFLIEPHLGYNVSGSGDGNANVEYDYSGAQIGARLGYQNLGLMLGLGFNRSSFEEKTTTTSGSVSRADQERNEWGVFAGYNLPILLRAWGAYYFSNTTKSKPTGDERTGNTKELGLGFTGLPFISLNLVYRIVDLDEIEYTNGSKAAINDTNKEIVLGVSLPLTL